MKNVKEIIAFVDKNSYFTLDGDDDDVVMFATRENGCVGSETSSDDDYVEGIQLMELLKSNFDVDCSIETVDEWVHIEVTNKKKLVDIIRYKFKKDLEGCGFIETFDSMEELIKKFDSWIVVDWDDIISKLNNINEYPNDKFTGDYDSNSLLIKRRGEEGNTWGYNFYIIKNCEKVLVDSE